MPPPLAQAVQYLAPAYPSDMRLHPRSPRALPLVLAACAATWAATSCTVPSGTAATATARPPTDESQVQRRTPPGTRPRNVVLMIGDGMGLTQITAALYANDNEIAFERMPVVGLHKSYSSDDLITDSAAGATAFACGEKTYNGAIAVRPDHSPCTTLLERAEAAGMPTGLVATSTIVHATPAAFYAHVDSRRDYPEIAAQLATSGVDFWVGGGQQFFARRDDGRDVVAEMTAAGRTVESYFERATAEMSPDPTRPYAYLTADEDPLPASGGRDYLTRATELALDYLSDRDTADAGFFLMVEGSQIDWGGHANDSEYIISETREFADVVGDVLDFAQRDGETLVVVTADHETGGYAINKGSELGRIEGAFTSDYHTADLIPVFAAGPGAELFGGIYENTAIHDKLLALQFGE